MSLYWLRSMLIIDVHAHITSPDEKRYPPKSAPLRVPTGKGSVEDLRAVMRANGVGAVRAIQTVSFYGYDNRYLCDSAIKHKGWLAGVCTLDPDDPHSPGLLQHYARKYGVKSLRSVPSPSRRTFDDDGVRKLWKVVVDEGISVDIFLMRPELVESASRLMKDFPGLTIGFCHCMDLKPGPELEPSLKAVCDLARFKNLYAKVDFIGTGTQMKYPCTDLHKAALRVIDAYGPERCVWGSCFPNELWTPNVTYAEHLRIFAEALPLSQEARRWILGETARKIWFPTLKA
jgi:predicted TIM-barrel fold metal-dependent hydrolase